jgi:hypothetical protein
MFKNIQNFLISFYRAAAIGILTVIIGGVLSYLFLLTFYFINNSWGTPQILSPTQEHVLAFQPQIAALESNLLKQRVDLASAENKYFVGIKQQLDIQKFLIRAKTAQEEESRSLASVSEAFNNVSRDKSSDIRANEATLKAITEVSKGIDSELQAGLITKDQAQSRRLMLLSAGISLSDAKIQAVTLQEQSRVARDASSTLTGKSSSSLQAMRSVQEQVQLRTMLSQIEVDTETAKQAIEQLNQSMAENLRVLTVAKTSPYYLALRNPLVVLFVPYKNMSNAKIGSTIYDCYLQVIACHKVGTVEAIYDAEETSRHPLFKNDIKGRLVGIKLDNLRYAETGIVFIGGKPLLL